MAQLNSWRRCTAASRLRILWVWGAANTSFPRGRRCMCCAQRVAVKSVMPKSLVMCVCVCDANRKYTKEVLSSQYNVTIRVWSIRCYLWMVRKQTKASRSARQPHRNQRKRNYLLDSFLRLVSTRDCYKLGDGFLTTRRSGRTTRQRRWDPGIFSFFAERGASHCCPPCCCSCSCTCSSPISGSQAAEDETSGASHSRRNRWQGREHPRSNGS